MTRALVVIDMQQGFDDLDFWGPTANLDCEANVARLIAAFAGSRWWSCGTTLGIRIRRCIPPTQATRSSMLSRRRMPRCW
ncbi:hypothetical protein [Microbacterium schleiferi]|uniref:hypothetical protein n=1 Tax=Microbacterium schleiferi TaxID=69362 RepID=UPI001E518DA0|nr:hypothetical protein [Microbacterium schleiferi]